LRKGNLTDLEQGLELIKEKIIEKSALTLEQTLERLSEKDSHIEIVELDKKPIGIHIWYGPYENEGESCYIWLGAIKDVGKGIGSEMIRLSLRNMRGLGYKRVYVKTKTKNILAKKALEKNGFKEYDIDSSGISYLKREL
jgi:RimJ/RimL family protein N-acetyltransferase